MSKRSIPLSAYVENPRDPNYRDDQAPTKVSVVASWDSVNPFEITFTFNTVQGMRSWPTSRELLADAITSGVPVGTGDVQFEPVFPDHLCMTLESNTGYAEITMRLAPLRQFIKSTERVTKIGQEPPTFADDEALWTWMEGAEAA